MRDLQPLLLGVLAALAPLAAEANLRAPRVEPAPPSSALSTSAALHVVAEALRITCGADCAVEAVYEVEADEASTVELDFVLPVASRVSAWVSGEAVSVTTAESLATRRGALWRATFAGAVKRGRNTVRVSYAQPVGTAEVGHGYASRGVDRSTVQYELWPLKEWLVDPGFHLDLTLRVPLVEGPLVALRCFDGEGRPLSPRSLDAGPRQAVARYAFTTDFPDRIECQFSPGDRR